MTFTCCRRNAANVAHSCILRAAQDPSTQRVRRHAGSHPGKNEARAAHRPAETEAIPLTRTNHCFHKPPYLQLPCYGPAAGRTPEADVCVPPGPRLSHAPHTSAAEPLPSVGLSRHRPQTALPAAAGVRSRRARVRERSTSLTAPPATGQAAAAAPRETVPARGFSGR